MAENANKNETGGTSSAPCAGSAYMYADIEDLFSTCFRTDDITSRDKYIWRMARLNMPNVKHEAFREGA